MRSSKYQHDLEIHSFIRYFESKFREIGIDVDTRFLDYFSFCPRCKSEFKIYNNILKGIASVSCYLLLEQNKAVLYGVCKKCARELSSGSVVRSSYNTEENIVAVIPDLKRVKNDFTEEEIQKEFSILNRL